MGLGGQEDGVADVNLKVDVDRALDVIPRINAAKLGDAIRVGAQRLTLDGSVYCHVLTGVQTFGVAMPDVDHRIGDRLACGRVDGAQGDDQGCISLAREMSALPVKRDQAR